MTGPGKIPTEKAVIEQDASTTEPTRRSQRQRLRRKSESDVQDQGVTDCTETQAGCTGRDIPHRGETARNTGRVYSRDIPHWGSSLQACLSLSYRRPSDKCIPPVTYRRPSDRCCLQSPTAVLHTSAAYLQSPTAVLQTGAAYLQSPTAVLQTGAAYLQSPTAVLQTGAAYLQSPTAVLGLVVRHAPPELVCLFVGWLLNVSATCLCISRTDLHRQIYVLPH